MPHRSSILIALSAIAMNSCADGEDAARAKFTKSQQLVIAAFELDVAQVRTLLKEDATPDARLGVYDEHLFEDKWTLGYSHIGSNKWTPLLAVANSHRAPQPQERARNTSEGLDAAMKKLRSINPELIRERDKRRTAIARLLIAAKANLDVDDGYGATALSASVYHGFDDLSLLLIGSGAKLDTKTGVYIDGTGDITPLHRATGSPPVLEAMIKRGASVNVEDSSGETPLHWAVRAANVSSVKLLLNAGADVKAKDTEGRTPCYWSKTYDGINAPGDAERKRIAKLLMDARSDK